MKPIEIIRTIRDRLFLIATAGKKTVNLNGLRFSVEDMSPRMRYVMFRGYEAGDAALALKHLGPGDSVLEAGGAIGYMALNCHKASILDYAIVEANPELLAVIDRNFALNDLPPPLKFNFAVAANDGELSFGISKNLWSSSILSRALEQKRITVKARSIPSLMEILPFKPNTLILDIEGGEAEIPTEHFAEFDKILIEVHPKLIGMEAAERVLDRIRSAGLSELDRDGGVVFFARKHRR